MNAVDRFRLDGRTAVVTGGARGIGLATAALSAAAGADIAIVDILGKRGRASAAKLHSESGRTVRFYEADLRDAKRANAVADEIVSDFGNIDILYNCIGIGPNTDLLAISPEEWRDVIDVNVNAQFFIAQAVARHMVAEGGGSIVAIGSNSGLIVDRPQPQAHYNASKAAVHQMVKSMAIELAPHKIRVNAVAPGFIMTEMTEAGAANPEWMEAWTGNTPLARLGKPDEIAYAMLFLASDAASYMTGSILVVDGGYTCW
jgi:NAD(P)-dependent dehydrogenase (short-subunit alcohol dehydrogenase family)